MAKEESKLVETVEESTETVETLETTEQKENGIDDKFNPLAFTKDSGIADLIGEEKEKAKETESKSDDEEEDQDDESWKWEKDKEEEKKDEDEEYNWEDEVIEEKKDEKKEEKGSLGGDIDWKQVAEELGVAASSKDEILNSIKTYIQQNSQPVGDSQISEFKRYLSFADRDLVGEELKADGIDESEIEESLDKLEDAGMLKMKAKSIRRLINNAIESQTTNYNEAVAQEKSKRKESAGKARDALKGYLKNMNEFMGGKVTKKQKEDVYKYATNDLMNDVMASHANVADVAMFMLYRKQIEKILRSQGLEEGKASIMNSITSPNLNSGKNKSNFKVKSGKFDPKSFMSE